LYFFSLYKKNIVIDQCDVLLERLSFPRSLKKQEDLTIIRKLFLSSSEEKSLKVQASRGHENNGKINKHITVSTYIWALCVMINYNREAYFGISYQLRACSLEWNLFHTVASNEIITAFDLILTWYISSLWDTVSFKHPTQSCKKFKSLYKNTRLLQALISMLQNYLN